MLAALNVYARDTGHLLELVLLAWFYATPILYPYQLVSNKLVEHDILHWLPLAQPHRRPDDRPRSGASTAPARSTTRARSAARRPALLPDASVWWYFGNVGIVFAISVGLFVLAIKLFDRAEGNFAEVM